MENNKTLRENIEWLLNQYKKELEYEKNEKEPNDDIINDYENVITELEFALKVSKKDGE